MYDTTPAGTFYVLGCGCESTMYIGEPRQNRSFDGPPSTGSETSFRPEEARRWDSQAEALRSIAREPTVFLSTLTSCAFRVIEVTTVETEVTFTTKEL